jgi:hypothetical protein
MTFLPELFSRRLIYARRRTAERAFSGVSTVFHQNYYMLLKKQSAKLLEIFGGMRDFELFREIWI